MLCQVRGHLLPRFHAYMRHTSYDLELDQKLAEETTVLVESYTVRCLCLGHGTLSYRVSFLTGGR